MVNLTSSSIINRIEKLFFSEDSKSSDNINLSEIISLKVQRIIVRIAYSARHLISKFDWMFILLPSKFKNLVSSSKKLDKIKIKEIKNSEKTVLTTHSRALFADYKHDTLIFDEDPLNHIFQIKELNINELLIIKMFPFKRQQEK
jgi:hypothetical protein